MNVQQLIHLLASLPPAATVLLEDDGGVSPLGGVELLPAQPPDQPPEVLLRPDMTPD